MVSEPAALCGDGLHAFGGGGTGATVPRYLIFGRSGERGDAFELDNEAVDAKTIAVNGAAQNHSIHVVGDTDWIKFTLAAKQDVTIKTSGPSGDPAMWLYGPNTPNTTIQYADDNGASKFPVITRTLTPGTVLGEDPADEQRLHHSQLHGRGDRDLSRADPPGVQSAVRAQDLSPLAGQRK